MSSPPATLADLHRCYDGPIPDGLRDQALAGPLLTVPTLRQRANRDLDQLALATSRSLAGWRAATRSIDAARCAAADPAPLRLTQALRSHRETAVALHAKR